MALKALLAFGTDQVRLSIKVRSCWHSSSTFSTMAMQKCESRRESDADWAQFVDDTVQQSLIPKADSWYMGANIPGKRRESLNFTGGVPLYLEKCKEAADSGYAGFVFS
jgi:hypothetical protein